MNPALIGRAREILADLFGEELGPRVRMLLNRELAALLRLRAEGQVALVPLPDVPPFLRGASETEAYVEVEHTGDRSNLRRCLLVVLGGSVAVPWSPAGALAEKRHFEALADYFAALGATDDPPELGTTTSGAFTVALDSAEPAAGRQQLEGTFTVVNRPEDASGSGPWIRVLEVTLVQTAE